MKAASLLIASIFALGLAAPAPAQETQTCAPPMRSAAHGFR